MPGARPLVVLFGYGPRQNWPLPRPGVLIEARVMDRLPVYSGLALGQSSGHRSELRLQVSHGITINVPLPTYTVSISVSLSVYSRNLFLKASYQAERFRLV